MESLGNDTGISQPSARHWISLLEAGYIGFRLPPYFATISKRLIKAPKFYFYDVGLAAHLMGINNAEQLHRHPLRGMLFENMVVMEAKKYFLNQGIRPQMFFYRDSNGNEVDLVLNVATHCVPIEIKSAATLSSSFFQGLDRFAKGVPSAQHPLLVYDGIQNHQQHGVQVLNFRALCGYLEM